MKCEFSPQAYQWRDGDAHHVGRKVTYCEKPIEATNGITSYSDEYDMVLMSHSHTRELEFVRFGDLRPYPSEPIPTP